MKVTTVGTDDLGDRTYIAHDGRYAVVIDPQRDLDRIEQALSDLGVTVSLVLETHIHNDYVTGGFALAQNVGAMYGVNAADQVAFDREPIRDGDRLAVGDLVVDVLATPGHTDTHLSFLVQDWHGDGIVPVVFSGGSLLFGGVGRTDLIDPRRTDELTRAQFRSVRSLASLLPDSSAVYPTHGFGSFCSVQGPTDRTSSTVGVERTSNLALTLADEDEFVRELVASLSPYPRYYSQMAPLNRLGPPAADLSAPVTATPADILDDLRRGAWVVDLRPGPVYAADHLQGTINIAAGPQLTATLGWLKPWDAPLTLIGDSVETLREAQRQLARIGIAVARAATWASCVSAETQTLLRSYPMATFADLRRTLEDDSPHDVLVLDVRDAKEYAAGHVSGSLNLPTYKLAEQLERLPQQGIWVHCAAGYRSAAAASLIARSGREVVYVADSIDSAASLGLIAPAEAAAGRR